MGYPLEGYRVIDFATFAAGPAVGSILADFGAEVIKVESKVRLDAMRMGPENLERHPEKDPAFLQVNRNKLGITLNFGKTEAIALAKELVKKSDIVVENFSPHVMPKWGLDYQSLRQVKPDIIMVSLSAAGQHGPLRDIITFGSTLSSLCGIDSLVGYEGGGPLGTQGFFADWNSPIHAAFAVLTALWHREETGAGQYIDAAQWPLTISCLGEAVMDYAMNQRVMQPRGNLQPGIAPNNVYPCQGEDKWVSISIKTDDEWQRFCEAMSHPRWAEEFDDPLARRQNHEALDKLISEWTRGYNHHEVAEILQKAGVAAAPFLDSSERFLDPHLVERKAYDEVNHPLMGTQLVGGVLWKLSGTPGDIRRHAPLIGEHNDYVFRDILGLSPEAVSRLVEEEVIY